MPLPAIAELVDGGSAVFLKVDEDPTSPRVLVQHGDRERPEIWTLDELAERFAGRLLLMTSRERMAGDARAVRHQLVHPGAGEISRARCATC